jgi:hypothetical protein
MDAAKALIAAIQYVVSKANISGVSGWNLSDQQLLVFVNQYTVPNPNPVPPPIPVPWSAVSIFSLLSSASRAAIETYQGGVVFNTIHDDAVNLRAANIISCFITLSTMSTPLITPAEATAIENAVTATTPDPSYVANMSYIGANYLGGYQCVLSDITNARNSQ